MEADPLNAAAHNGLGLVAEARSSYAEASEAYELALQLASTGLGISSPHQAPHQSQNLLQSFSIFLSALCLVTTVAPAQMGLLP